MLLRLQRSLFEEGEAANGLDEFQGFTARTDRNARPGAQGLGFVLLGLFGEVGSLLSALKKKQRDRDAFVAYHDDVIEELATASGISRTPRFARLAAVADRAQGAREFGRLGLSGASRPCVLRRTAA
jgi:hypothetical protein